MIVYGERREVRVEAIWASRLALSNRILFEVNLIKGKVAKLSSIDDAFHISSQEFAASKIGAASDDKSDELLVSSQKL